MRKRRNANGDAGGASDGHCGASKQANEGGAMRAVCQTNLHPVRGPMRGPGTATSNRPSSAGVFVGFIL